MSSMNHLQVIRGTYTLFIRFQYPTMHYVSFLSDRHSFLTYSSLMLQGETSYFKDSCECGCKKCTPIGHHMCGDGHCIPPTQVCDGIDQCDNDEKNCGMCYHDCTL